MKAEPEPTTLVSDETYEGADERMLTMTDVNNIRDAVFEKGYSISEAAREFHKDRKTVRKYIDKDNFNQDAREHVAVPKRPTKLSPYMPKIDVWLEDDKRMRRKQRHTAMRIYDRLCQEVKGFCCSYRSVANYVKSKKEELYTKTMGTIPLIHKAGEAQADFGDVDFCERGRRICGKYLTLSFPYSNAAYTQIFYGETAECLFEGLWTIFEEIGGIPTSIWFDNASSMVTKVLPDGKREQTEAFMRFRQHCGFEAAFCNPRAGYEKGNVENKIGYHRRNLFVPMPEMSDIRLYNKELLKRCAADHDREHYRYNETIEERHKADTALLLPLPSMAFDCARYESFRLDGCGRFRIGDRHTYSAHPSCACKRITVKLTAFTVEPLDEKGRAITVHPRAYGAEKSESMDWMPYLTQLSRSPGAAKYTGIYPILPEPLRDCLDGQTKQEKRGTLKLLAELTKKDGFEKAAQSVSAALSAGATDTESLLSIHRALIQQPFTNSMILKEGQAPELPSFTFTAGLYDNLLKQEAQSC